MKPSFLACVPLACLASMAASLAHAQSGLPEAGQFVVRGGVADIRFDSGAKFTAAGAPLSGANLELSNETTAAFEFDYHLRPQVSLSLTFGVPPETNAEGRGTLAPFGRLGSARFGTAVAQAKYHFAGMGHFQPWVGAGVTRMIIFDTTDGSVQNLKVDDAWGGAVQAGGEYMLNSRWGIYGSVSRLFLKTNGSASLGGIPISAKIDLNPTIVQGGLSARF
ncbi:MAG: OmpW family protein [Caulobacteraceae bacterium]|nr:OmpW family protein [Caulobacteraceae bacterium]